MADAATNAEQDDGIHLPAPSMSALTEDSTPSVINSGMDSSLDSAVAGALPVGKSEIKSLYQKGLQATRDQAKNEADTQSAVAKAADAYVKRNQELEKSRPTPPKETPLPTPPENNPMQRFGSLASTLGIFASTFTKHRMVNALNSSAAAMNAQRAGDIETYKLNYEKAKEDTRIGLERYQKDRDAYADALKDADTDYAGTLAKVKALGAAAGWPALATLSEIGLMDQMYKHLEASDAAAEKLKKSQLEMDELHLKIDKAQREKAAYDEAYKENLDKGLPSSQARVLATNASKGKDEGAWDDDTIKFAGQMYYKTGVMPAVGLGGTDVRGKIIKAAKDLAEADKKSPAEVATSQSAFKADAKSLSSMTSQYDNIVQFEHLTEDNTKNAIRLGEKGAGTSMGPVVNRWLQAGRRATGDPDVAAFNGAITTAANEFGRVMTGGTPGARLTDSAREEAESVLSKIDSLDAIKEVFNQTMKVDMNNRKNDLQAQIDEIKGRLSGEPTAGGEDKIEKGDLPAGSVLIGTDRKTGKKVYQAPDGSKFLAE